MLIYRYHKGGRYASKQHKKSLQVYKKNAALGMLILVDGWSQVELPIIMFNDANMYPLSVYLSGIRENAIGITFAATVIYAIPVILFFLYGAKELEAGTGSY